MAKELHVLNLGAGVQSTALYLMSLRRDEPEHVPVFDFAIFADTQEEPAEVYAHLEWLKTLGGPPIMVRTYGKLGDDLINGHHQLTRRETAKHRPGEQVGQVYHVPAFLAMPDGTTAIVRRKCTEAYKINVINRAIREEIVGIDKGARFPVKAVRVVQYFGLSYDEPQRVTKTQALARGRGWFDPKFPLFDLEMTRGDCLAYLAEAAPGRTVARSACVFCPYKQNSEWRRLRDEDPAGWERACEIDEAIRDPGSACRSDLRGVQYLHRSCVPLRGAPIEEVGRDLPGQNVFGFAQECEGMCGV
jgi:hypothetical protein